MEASDRDASEASGQGTGGTCGSGELIVMPLGGFRESIVGPSYMYESESDFDTSFVDGAHAVRCDWYACEFDVMKDCALLEKSLIASHRKGCRGC